MTISDLDWNKATLTWVAPVQTGGAPIDHYEVVCTVEGSSPPVSVGPQSFPGTTTGTDGFTGKAEPLSSLSRSMLFKAVKRRGEGECNIKVTSMCPFPGLDAGTPYACVVTVFNTAGASATSDPSSAVATPPNYIYFTNSGDSTSCFYLIACVYVPPTSYGSNPDLVNCNHIYDTTPSQGTANDYMKENNGIAVVGETIFRKHKLNLRLLWSHLTMHEISIIAIILCCYCVCSHSSRGPGPER